MSSHACPEKPSPFRRRSDHASSMFPWPGIRTDFGSCLSIGEGPEFSGDPPSDRGSLAACLETGEVRTVAPGERTAEPLAGGEGGVMHNIDEPFVIGFALFVA